MKHIRTVSHTRPAKAMSLGFKALLAAILFAKEAD